MRRVHQGLVKATVVAIATWLVPAMAWAQNNAAEPLAITPKGLAPAFPAKSVRYVVTFAAGAAPDIVARILADRLSRVWGQQMIVENRVGVAGLLGAASVAKAPPDGYTLVQCNVGTNAIAMSLYAKLPFDQLRDFAPVTRIGTTANLIVVHPSVPFKTIKEFVAYARAHPGKLSFSAGLAGTSPPLSMELLVLCY